MDVLDIIKSVLFSKESSVSNLMYNFMMLIKLLKLISLT